MKTYNFRLWSLTSNIVQWEYTAECIDDAHAVKLAGHQLKLLANPSIESVVVFQAGRLVGSVKLEILSVFTPDS